MQSNETTGKKNENFRLLAENIISISDLMLSIDCGCSFGVFK